MSQEHHPSGLSGVPARFARSVAEHFGRGRRDPDVVYANEYARMSYETAAAVRKLDRELPQDEGNTIPLEAIRFHPEHAERGHVVLLFAGDFMFTDEKDDEIHFVRPRTRKMLDKLHIRYHLSQPTAV